MAEQVIEPIVNVNRKSVHHFDESKEDIDGNEVNSLFGHHYDSDSDSLSSLSVVDDKNMKDQIEQLKSEIQEKANIIANLTLRYDLGILPSNDHTETDISADVLAQHATKLNSQTTAENFELRDMVNELRDENFHLRNEIYELQDKINRQVLQINKLEKDLREQPFESEQQEIKEDNVPLSDLSDLFESSEPNVNDYILPDSLFDHLSPEPPTFEQELADGYDPFPLRDSTKILMQTITPGDRATFAEPFAEVDVQYQGFRFVDDRWQKFTTAAVDETVFVTQLGRHQNVIGLEQAILSMSKGEVCRVFVPSRLGYGEHGAEGLIPSNTDILFELTLVDVRNDVRTIDMEINDGLEEKVEEKSTEDTQEENKCAHIQSYKAQFVSHFFNFFSYLCLAYEYYSEVVYDYIVNNGFELHLVGIGRPKDYETSEIKLFDHINTENTMISVKTPLKAIHSVRRLKKFIKDIYGITDKDLLILFSHVPLTNDRATLGEIGISNKSLLTLAICNEEQLKLSADPVVVEPILFSEPVASVNELFADSDAESDDDSSEDEQILYVDSDEDESSEYESSVNNADAVNALFEMYEDYESEYETEFVANQFLCIENGKVAKEKKQKVVDEIMEEIVEEKEEKWPQLGFDVITQCSDVLVHKMPNCGHKMNRESLLEYALSAFADSKTMKLKCPHSIDENNTLCNYEWDYTEILNILQYGDEDKEDWTKYAKLELLASRNVIENELECQKCPSCHSLYFRNYRENKRALDDISTVKDVENEFKFECIFCEPNTETIVERIEIKNKFINVGLHFEDDVEEDIDGDAVNSLFGQDDDESDNDSDDEDEDNSDSDDEEDGQRAIRFIEHMFDDDETEYEEKVTIKMDNQFCFCCGDKWSDKHVCDSSFKKDLVAILEDAPKKQIDSVENVPSIRSCPSCAQLIFHMEACKHMNCSACHTDFCFVCLKPKKNGRWQCGSYSDACPVADTQTEESLPDTIVITKKAFQLF